mmetsp:Transcript_26820/g.77297  ORF Transcript_26820/g.77297 Transcript_26820/m.77297 type:complete len:241 (-) Transcript_26820:120-842(-)
MHLVVCRLFRDRVAPDLRRTRHASQIRRGALVRDALVGYQRAPLWYGQHRHRRDGQLESAAPSRALPRQEHPQARGRREHGRGKLHARGDRVGGRVRPKLQLRLGVVGVALGGAAVAYDDAVLHRLTRLWERGVLLVFEPSAKLGVPERLPLRPRHGARHHHRGVGASGVGAPERSAGERRASSPQRPVSRGRREGARAAAPRRGRRRGGCALRAVACAGGRGLRAELHLLARGSEDRLV